MHFELEFHLPEKAPVEWPYSLLEEARAINGVMEVTHPTV